MELCDKKICTACGVCAAVCPQNAVKFKTDRQGFSYPQIDLGLCTSCGLCMKKCPAVNQVEKNMPQKACALWSNDPEDRKTSTSGGAASVFYQRVLEQGGVCYGAAYDGSLNVVIRGCNDESIVSFKNSKYVHSAMNEVYKDIRDNLNIGKKVIFIGLPCQAAAVKAYLGRDYENLILVDIVCHGTPPAEYLLSHVKALEGNQGKRAGQIKFRNDNEFYFMLSEKEGEKPFVAVHKDIDTYMLSFFEALTYYESCYTCKYACGERVSHITIGDFWGLGAEHPFEHPYTGAISLALINTPRGSEFFDEIKEKCFVEERQVSEALKGNAQLNNPSVRHSERDKFLSAYEAKGFEDAVLSVYGKRIKENRTAVKKYETGKKLRAAAKKLLGR